jgi:hypothetical protein
MNVLIFFKSCFCHQLAERVPDMFCNDYFANNPKFANSSTTAEARGKVSTDL